jgi:hypothetical protein
MQTTLRQYNFSSSWPRYINDKPVVDPELAVKIRDAAELFRVRLARLVDLSHPTTRADEEALRLTLGILIAAKRHANGYGNTAD